MLSPTNRFAPYCALGPRLLILATFIRIPYLATSSMKWPDLWANLQGIYSFQSPVMVKLSKWLLGQMALLKVSPEQKSRAPRDDHFYIYLSWMCHEIECIERCRLWKTQCLSCRFVNTVGVCGGAKSFGQLATSPTDSFTSLNLT